LHWPPRDPYDLLRQSWEREAATSTGAAPPKSRYPPYHPAYSALDAQDEDDEDRLQNVYEDDASSDTDEDDDVPLSHLRQRSVRLRRGSEGLEVRPLGMGVGEFYEEKEDDNQDRATNAGQNGAGSDSDWEELYDTRKGPTLYDSASEDDE
jgi:hypothetical protein